ncbi:PRC-barrel domain-containing protein [Chachezhania sediminis]|uniref:PRC-barrel domain-containing protein n=1 Tax=Chachezhania sediminis TaxID=2599291 RepID=UPI00131C7365|nr:PRC-barrel domain-containing protein [Chachezhania sediminis]
MKTLAILAATSFLATAAAAEVIKAEEPVDQATLIQENNEFIGNPVYSSDGQMIGAVTESYVTADGDHSLVVTFNNTFSEEMGGMTFELDDKWTSGGSLEFAETAEELRGLLAYNLTAQENESAM